MTIGDILAYKSDRDDDSDLLATIGMLRSDLVEILANICVAVDGLEEVISNNPSLQNRDISLIRAAVINHEDLYDLFTLGVDIPQCEVDRVVRNIRAKAKLISQMEDAQYQLSGIVEEESKVKKCSKKPDAMKRSLFGDEHI
jgi:hypothetical protein